MLFIAVALVPTFPASLFIFHFWVCLVSFVSGLLFHACIVFRPFCVSAALQFSFIFAQYVLQFVIRNLAFLYFIPGIVRVFSFRRLVRVYLCFGICRFLCCFVYASAIVFVLFSRRLSGVYFRSLFRICRFSLQFSFVCAFSRY